MKTLCFAGFIVCLVVLLMAPAGADSQVWDAWIYRWVTVEDNSNGHPGNKHTICNPVYDVNANPIECGEDYYYANLPDRFRFTFDGYNLLLNGTRIETVGNSSKRASDLLLSGSWAVCGTVTDNVFTPDPFATFVDGHVQWAAGTPAGYTANLLLGYSFEGDGAATYYQHPSGFKHPVQGTLVVRTYSPFMQCGYPDFYDVRTHVFTATHPATTCIPVPCPEPSGVIALLCGIAGISSVYQRRTR